MDPAQTIHERFLSALAKNDLPRFRRGERTPESIGLTGAALVDLFHSQIVSRQLDRIARNLQAAGEGFYTIGSAGHEGNAALAAASRLTDMAFLHYRDAAFQIQRAKQRPGETPIWDMLLSFTASADDPISGGRHKVLGSKALFIPPQTSTIASHLPKAVGAAFSIGAARAIGDIETVMPDDAIIICSFGDASANHSTAQGAINTACWAAYQGAPMPIIFLCEDNGVGISTRTPSGWIAASFCNRSGLEYIACNGADPLATYEAARKAVETARKRRKPVFLHMACTRLYGHAGSDVQGAYMSKDEIAASEARDPLLSAAALICDLGLMRCDEIAEMYESVGETVAHVAKDATARPKLETSAQVMASIVPPRRLRSLAPIPDNRARAALFGSDWAQMEKPQPMAKLISWALTDLMAQHREIIVAGEDIGPKGGVYNATARLHQRFGAARVINTLLDEQSILGLGVGCAHNGLLPITEIQFLAYVHNAEDQLRGEAATLPFFSQGQFTNPMIVRIAGLPYQKGFGGHFHNDNSLAVFRDIPGLVIACPSSGRDAVAMLRECVRLAREEQRVVIFIEPIALYMTRDLHALDDGLMAARYETPGNGAGAPFGQPGVFGDGDDLAIITYGNGVFLSRQAQRILAQEHDLQVRIIDLRWLAPLDEAALLAAVGERSRLLIVDECRATGSQSEGLMTFFAEHAPGKQCRRITADE